jgi:hypothetical protein
MSEEMVNLLLSWRPLALSAHTVQPCRTSSVALARPTCIPTIHLRARVNKTLPYNEAIESLHDHLWSELGQGFTGVLEQGYATRTAAAAA